jgi:riboflavin kinase/FMN adenylyltransferase
MKDVLGAAGVAVTVFEPITTVVGGEETVVSSTRVRAALGAGKVEAAREMLGRPFVVDGAVERGAGRGKQIGFPTANVRADTEAMPTPGIYAGFVEVAGARHIAAISLGRNPTFADPHGGPGRMTLEPHLLDFEGDLYGTRVSVGFCAHLRDELKFAGVEALVAQIRADVEQTRAIMRNDPALLPEEGRGRVGQP